MDYRDELARQIAARVRQRFAARSPLQDAPVGELNSALSAEISASLSQVPDPYGQLIRDWPGQAHQLDLAWWESESTPAQIVLGLAAAILEYEVRHLLDLPR